jgi:hypothetical protein
MQPKGGKQMAKRGRGRPRRSSNEGSNFEVILNRLREAFNEQYQRGSDDAMRQILSVAQGGGSTGSRAVASKPAGGKKKRAPRGTAKSLVERVLASGARTVREITEAANSEAERLLSGSAVRLELERGKRDKRYVNRGGKWGLRGGKA